MIRLAIIPIGKSRCGFFVSSAVVDTASNPMNAKNTMAAPLITPPNPLGMKGCQLVGLTRNAPKEMTNMTTATLVTTINATRPFEFRDARNAIINCGWREQLGRFFWGQVTNGHERCSDSVPFDIVFHISAVIPQRIRRDELVQGRVLLRLGRIPFAR